MTDLAMDAEAVHGLSRRLRQASARLADEGPLAGADGGDLGAVVVESAVAASAAAHDAMVRHATHELDALADGAVGTARAVASADDRLAREAR